MKRPRKAECPNCHHKFIILTKYKTQETMRCPNCGEREPMRLK